MLVPKLYVYHWFVKKPALAPFNMWIPYCWFIHISLQEIVRFQQQLCFVPFCIVNLVKNVIPAQLSPPGAPWTRKDCNNQQGPPSPSSISSTSSTSPGYSPSRTLDLSGSSTSFSSERKNAHHWQNGPVQEWTKEQVTILKWIKRTVNSIDSICW